MSKPDYVKSITQAIEVLKGILDRENSLINPFETDKYVIRHKTNGMYVRDRHGRLDWFNRARVYNEAGHAKNALIQMSYYSKSYRNSWSKSGPIKQSDFEIVQVKLSLQ